MRRTLPLIFVLWAAYLTAFSQGEIPVDLFTGTPSISIPIWNVVSGGISEPVMLSYNANRDHQKSPMGVGWAINAGGSVTREVRSYPDDEAYLIKGWLYPVSGGVTSAATINSYSLTADTLTSTSSDEYHASTVKDWNKLNSFNYLVDTEPDIFYYNCGGVSGSFVFDEDEIIRTIPYQDVKIEFEYQNELAGDKQIIGFTITTNNGYVYSFYSKVNVTKSCSISIWPHAAYYTTTEYELYKTPVEFTREWKLTNIYCPDGTTVTFTYTEPFSNLNENNARSEEIGLYQTKDLSYTDPTDIRTYSVYGISESYSPTFISTITASTGPKVVFNYAQDLLRSISISDTRRGATSGEQFIKSFVLKHRPVTYTYDRFANYLSGEVGQFLESVTEVSGCEKIPPYKFDYYGIYELKAPYNVGVYSRLPKAPDKPFPKIYIYPNEPAALRYRTTPIPGYTGTCYTLDGHSSGPNNSSNWLKSMTSPEGGTTTFNFESNSYDDPIGGGGTAPGLRIQSISYYDGFNTVPIKKTFEYIDPATGKSSGRISRKPEYAKPILIWKSASGSSYDKTVASFTTGQEEEKWRYMTARTTTDMTSSEAQLGYTVVTVKRPGAGSAKHEFLMPATHGTFSNGAWKATTNVFARPSATSMGIVDKGGAYMYPFTRNPNFDYERGLPLRKSEYNEAGKLVRKIETSYQYIYKSGSQPYKVFGLRYERYPGSDPNNKIFLHGRYFLLTEVQKVPMKEKVTTYDVSDTTGATYLTDSTEYFYQSANHKFLTQIKRYTSDGKIYATRLKYPEDYTYTLTGATDAATIGYLKLYDRTGLPVEQIQTLKKAADSTEYVIGGSVVKFDNMGFGTSRQFIRSSWALKASPPIAYSSFINSEVVNASGYKFKIDPRYERVDSVLSYTTLGAVTASRNPVSRQTSVTGYGYNSTLPVVQLINASPGTAAFSDFETTTGFEFSSATGYYGLGRTGAKAFHPSVMLYKTVTKASVGNYILSFWVKSNATLTFTVNLRNTAGTVLYTTSVEVLSTNSEYTYVQKIIPVTAVSEATFKVELQANVAVPGSPAAGGYLATLLPVIDDIFFYPENAEMVATTYTIPFGAASATTGSGSTSYQEYDKLGRLRLVYDRDRNIVKRNTYNYVVENPITADFAVSFPYSVTLGVPSTFVAAENPCLTGLTYEWDFGSGFVSGTESKVHTFSATGIYEVKLRVTSPSNGTKTVSKTFVIVYPPLLVDICAKGVSQFAGTSVVSSYSCTSISGSPPTSSGVIFKATPSNPVSGETFTYSWLKRDLAASTWVNVGSGNQYTFAKVVPGTPSFVVKCEVTSGVGRFGTTTSMEVIVTP